jgi:hypothetical protein
MIKNGKGKINVLERLVISGRITRLGVKTIRITT